MSFPTLDTNYIKPWFAEITFASLSDFYVWKLKQRIVYPFEQFVFRGHSRCDTYKLLPTALRYGKDEMLRVLDFHPSKSVLSLQNIQYGLLLPNLLRLQIEWGCISQILLLSQRGYCIITI